MYRETRQGQMMSINQGNLQKTEIWWLSFCIFYIFYSTGHNFKNIKKRGVSGNELGFGDMCLSWLSCPSFGEISQTPTRFCHSTRTHGTVFISFLHMLGSSPVWVTLHDRTHTCWSSFQPDCLPTLCCAWVATWCKLLGQNSTWKRLQSPGQAEQSSSPGDEGVN